MSRADLPYVASYVWFGIADMLAFQGFDTGYRWNGWCVPLVPANRIVSVMRLLECESPDDEFLFRWRLQGDVVEITQCNGDPEQAVHDAARSRR